MYLEQFLRGILPQRLGERSQSRRSEQGRLVVQDATPIHSGAEQALDWLCSQGVDREAAGEALSATMVVARGELSSISSEKRSRAS